MAAIINFSKNEKLAILRIMIEINNYYKSSLPKASMFIQDVANHFDTPNGVYSLKVSEAQNILKDNLKLNTLKKTFLLNILNYMLKDDKITARYQNIEEKIKFSYDEKEKAIRDLNNGFRSKWAYAVKLTKNFLDLQLIYQYSNPLEKYSSITTTKSAINKQAPIDALDSSNYNLNTTSRKTENFNKTSDLSSVKEELRKELLDIVRKEFKEELRKELDVLRKEFKGFLSKVINEELNRGIKNIVHQNFNETLYKDL